MFARTILLAAALAVTTVSAHAAPSSRDRAALKQIMAGHVWLGSPVGRAARRGTGNPHIQVIDRRVYGEVSRCSFLVRSGQRVLLCES